MRLSKLIDAKEIETIISILLKSSLSLGHGSKKVNWHTLFVEHVAALA